MLILLWDVVQVLKIWETQKYFEDNVLEVSV